MGNARLYALPILGFLVIAAWLLLRSRVEEAAPASTTAPTQGTATPPSSRATADDSHGSEAKRVAAPTVEPPPATVRDAKRSNSIRTALRDRWRDDGDASPARGPAGAAADDGEAPTGTLDKDYIRARIREDLVPIAKECYESALEDDPKLAGKIVMTFGIAGDEEVGGVVDEAAIDPTSTLQHPELGECMRESMMSLSFPAPEGGGRVAVTYPFEFSSDGPAPK